MNQQLTLDPQEAVIYLKDGKRKYGMLMGTQPGDFYYFISGNDYGQFRKNKDKSYLETVPAILIETIDINLK